MFGTSFRHITKNNQIVRSFWSSSKKNVLKGEKNTKYKKDTPVPTVINKKMVYGGIGGVTFLGIVYLSTRKKKEKKEPTIDDIIKKRIQDALKNF